MPSVSLQPNSILSLFVTLQFFVLGLFFILFTCPSVQPISNCIAWSFLLLELPRSSFFFFWQVTCATTLWLGIGISTFQTCYSFVPGKNLLTIIVFFQFRIYTLWPHVLVPFSLPQHSASYNTAFLATFYMIMTFQSKWHSIIAQHTTSLSPHT